MGISDSASGFRSPQLKRSDSICKQKVPRGASGAAGSVVSFWVRMRHHFRIHSLCHVFFLSYIYNYICMYVYIYTHQYWHIATIRFFLSVSSIFRHDFDSMDINIPCTAFGSGRNALLALQEGAAIGGDSGTCAF